MLHTVYNKATLSTVALDSDVMLQGISNHQVQSNFWDTKHLGMIRTVKQLRKEMWNCWRHAVRNKHAFTAPAIYCASAW